MRFLRINILASAIKTVVIASAISTIAMLSGCGENRNKAPLESAIIQLDSMLVVVNGFQLDSIMSVRERLDNAKNDVRWLGLDSNITFIRSDAPVIGDLSKASRFLKDAPSRILGLKNQCDESLAQIKGLISIIDLGANSDANGDKIDSDYISLNTSIELGIVSDLDSVFRETSRYIRLGLETDAASWGKVDSLLRAKKSEWAHNIAGE